MARLLLDSTVLIDALHGRPAAARLAAWRRTGMEPWACVISVEEIWRGLRPGEEAVARRLFNGLRLAPLGATTARIQQRYGLYVQRQGLPRIPEEAIPEERPAARETEP